MAVSLIFSEILLLTLSLLVCYRTIFHVCRIKVAQTVVRFVSPHPHTLSARARVCVWGGGIINVRKFAPTSYVLLAVNSSSHDADGWRANIFI